MESAVGRHYEARLAAESRDRRPVDGVSVAWVGLGGVMRWCLQWGDTMKLD